VHGKGRPRDAPPGAVRLRAHIQGHQCIRQPSFDNTCGGAKRRAHRRRSLFGWQHSRAPPGTHGRRGVNPSAPAEMVPTRCGPDQAHNAATAGHRAAFNTTNRSPIARIGAGLVPAPPAARRHSGAPPPPTAALSSCRSGGASALLWAVGRVARLGCCCRLVAAITAVASRPVKPLTQRPFNTTCGGAKRRANRRRSLFGSTHFPGPLRRAWPPGGQPDHPPEMAPPRDGPSQGHRAATAGRKAACNNTPKGSPNDAP
jgi:hypothetical protein